MICFCLSSICVIIWWKSHCLNVQWFIKNLSDNFKYSKKNNSKIQILKLLKDQKILKNQMINYLEIIKTKQNIYD